MFTPPPSPAPFRAIRTPSPTRSVSKLDDTLLLPPCQSYAHPTSAPSSVPTSTDVRQLSKTRTTRRIRWTIVLVPVVLIIITATTRYISHPAFLDLWSANREPVGRHTIAEWQTHKRHADPDPAPMPVQDNTSGSAAPPPSSASASAVTSSPSSAPPTSLPPVGSQTVPTIPSAPPILPTPFPQPLDQSLSSNFTTQICENFFVNMTASTPFRACRPFSLLLQTSSAFINVSYLFFLGFYA